VDQLQLYKDILDKIKLLYNPDYDLEFVQEELPKVSKNNLLALVNRGILWKSKGILGDKGP
jgi:uncharacterized protein YqgQ